MGMEDVIASQKQLMFFPAFENQFDLIDYKNLVCIVVL